MPLPLTTSEIGPILQANEVLDYRVIIQGITVVPQVLISWKGLLAYAATWEDQEAMKLACPNFDH